MCETVVCLAIAERITDNNLLLLWLYAFCTFLGFYTCVSDHSYQVSHA